MGFLTKEGLQNLTNKLVQGDAIKVASHRGKNVKEVIDNIQRECENVALPNTMTLENRVSEFKVGKGRNVDVSGDVEEGKIEVELQGKTWQNLTGFGVGFQTQHSGVFEKIDDEDSLLVKRINSNDSGWAYWHNNKLKRTLIKPNTKYTLLFKFDSNKNHNLQVSLRDGSSRNPISNQISATRVFSNIYMVELTTVSSFNELGNGQVVYLHGGVPPKNGDWSRYYKDIILLEGDHTQTPLEELPRYFEGIKSSFEDGVVDIEVQGKNLFDGVYRFDYLQGGDVTIYCERESGDTRLALVKVEPYTTYTIKKERSVRNTMALFKEFPKDGDYYKSIVLSDLGTTIKTGDNNYLAVYVSNESEEPFLQVEKLNYPTPYEPYYKKKISFNIGEPLRSLPNGVCDEIRNNNGQWELVRRVGKRTFNGSENWRFAEGDTPFIYIIIPDVKYELSSLLCDTLPVRQDKADDMIGANRQLVPGIMSTGTIQEIRLRPGDLSTTLDASKAWLAQNPTTVYYELETPIITPIEPMEFDVKPLATMTIDSEIAPVSTHKVILNRAGQIEQGIELIANLKSRINELENIYDSNLIATQYRLNNLKLNYELEREED